ncbi:hypothetical protein [Bacillus marasmi]|uniref:hypothetical protein n=1 Tax=Bacillus marasmi TaxID=1926279 RepID=UPI0011CB7E21|nr:hypothetical protein [Bacillus marasmi]
MAYKVITNFFDIEDNKRLYEVGQTYPRAGFEVSQERIEYLLNKQNQFKGPFIKQVEDEVVEEEQPKRKKARGKKGAEKAEVSLKDGE